MRDILMFMLNERKSKENYEKKISNEYPSSVWTMGFYMQLRAFWWNFTFHSLYGCFSDEVSDEACYYTLVHLVACLLCTKFIVVLFQVKHTKWKIGCPVQGGFFLVLQMFGCTLHYTHGYDNVYVQLN